MSGCSVQSMIVSDAGSPVDHVDEAQRIVRMFVTDTVTATIGRGVQLNHWTSRSMYEKLRRDITLYYQNFGTVGAEAVQEISDRHDDLHQGLLYLHKHKTVVLLRVITKYDIGAIRAVSTAHPDREAAQQIASEIDAAGAQCTSSAVLYIPFDSNNDYDIHVEAYHPDSEEESKSQQFVKALGLATVTQSSARDVQRMPGPSDLANPCDLCVARRLASACGISMNQQPDRFSLKAWVGTSMHEKLENDLPSVYRFAKQEITVPIVAIPDFGSIKGHTDVFFPRKRAMSDWKSTDKKKLDYIKLHGVSSAHFGQTMLYMYGLRRAGMECDYATLTYIPRDSENVSDIWVASCSYREDVALGLLNRTRSLLDRLKSGDVVSMKSDPQCFVCTVQPRLRR